MTQTAEGGLLSAFLASLGVVADRPTTIRPEQPPPRLSLDLTLQLLASQLDSLVPVAPELASSRAMVADWLAEPAPGAPVPSVDELASLIGRAAGGQVMASVAGPDIEQLAVLSDPARYPPQFAVKVHQEADRIRKLYSAAISTALRSAEWDKAARKLAAARAAADAFPTYLRDQYLTSNLGYEHQISEANQSWADLRAVRQALGHDANYQVAPDGTWVLRPQLDNELGQVRAALSNHDPELESLVRTLTTDLQSASASMTALTFIEQLNYWAGELILHADLVERAHGYVSELNDVLSTLTQAASDRTQGRLALAAAEQVAATAHLAELAIRPVFVSDTHDLETAVQWQNAIEAAVLMLAVTAAAALTSGAAGTLVAGLAGEATVAGISIGAVAGFSVKVLWFTETTRLGKELLFGPEALEQSSFAEELLWNAAMMAVLDVADKGFMTAYAQLARANTLAVSAGFVLGRFATTQLTLFALAEMQTLLSQHRFMTGDEAVLNGMQLMVMGVAFMIGGFFRTPLKTRLSGVAGELDAVKLDILANRQTELAATFERIAAGAASGEEVAVYLRDSEALWQEILALLETLPAGDPVAVSTVEQFTLAKAEIELRLAHLGIGGAIPVPGAEPFFEPIRLGVVGFSEECLPVLQKIYAGQEGATLQPSRIAGVLEGRLADGQRTFYVPIGDVPAVVPGPAALALTRNAALYEALNDPIATAGLARLTNTTAGGLGARKTDFVLASAGDNVMDLLHFLAHPDFAQGGGIQLGEQWLAAVGRDPQSLALGRAYGPRLVHRLSLTLKAGSVRYNAARTRALEKLDEMTVPADRQALIDSLIAADRAGIETILGTARPKPQPPPTATKEDLGINRGSREWRILREEIEREFGATLTAEQKAGRADIEQVLTAARAHRFKVTVHTELLAMLTRFDTLCTASGLSIGERNAWRASLAEWLFLPRRGFLKSAFLNGERSQAGRLGAVIPDDWYQRNGISIALELKSDVIDRNQTDADLRAVARLYLDRAKVAMTHLPLGAEYELWFIRDPGAHGRQVMLEILRGADSRITRVYFGADGWVTVTRS